LSQCSRLGGLEDAWKNVVWFLGEVWKQGNNPTEGSVWDKNGGGKGRRRLDASEDDDSIWEFVDAEVEEDDGKLEGDGEGKDDRKLIDGRKDEKIRRPKNPLRGCLTSENYQRCSESSPNLPTAISFLLDFLGRTYSLLRINWLREKERYNATALTVPGISQIAMLAYWIVVVRSGEPKRGEKDERSVATTVNCITLRRLEQSDINAPIASFGLASLVL